eukprot:7901649-Ditylum_brightwellii.AAC.1
MLDKGQEIMLNMDGHEEDIEGSDRCKFHTGLSLVYIHSHLHPDNPPPHTYIQGKSYIDYML